MVTFGVVVLGVDDQERAAEFWARALGYVRGEYGWGGWAVNLIPPDGPGAAIAFQRSATPVRDHPRTHLDLHVNSPEEQKSEVERLIALGAAHVDWDGYEDDSDFVVLADTEGNRFCVVDLSHPR